MSDSIDKFPFSRELRDVESLEEAEVEHRKRIQKEQFDTERFSRCFVEYLNEHQLYESIWDGDDDGRILMLVGDQVEELANNYRSDVFQITQKIYKLGLEKFEERDLELKEFLKSIDDGRIAVQNSGRQIISEYLKFKEQNFSEAKVILTLLIPLSIEGEDEQSPEYEELTERFENISTAFTDRTNEVWQVVMSEETHLFESIEVYLKYTFNTMYLSKALLNIGNCNIFPT